MEDNKYMTGYSATTVDEMVYAEDVSDAARKFVQRRIAENGTKGFLGISREVFVEGEGMLNRVTVKVHMEPVVHTGQIVTLEIDGVGTGAE